MSSFYYAFDFYFFPAVGWRIHPVLWDVCDHRPRPPHTWQTAPFMRHPAIPLVQDAVDLEFFLYRALRMLWAQDFCANWGGAGAPRSRPSVLISSSSSGQ